MPKYRRAVRHAVPRYRELLGAQASSAATALRVLRSPPKVGMIFAGNLGAQLLQAIILGLCLRGFGHHATMAELLLVNSLASLLAGFMPVPGAWGRRGRLHRRTGRPGRPQRPRDVDRDRLPDVTYYLPPIWGAIAMRWLRQHSYL